MSEGGQNGRAPGDDVGATLAAEMVKQLVLLNQNLEIQNKLTAELQETLDDVVGHHEALSRAFELVLEKSEEGKSKWSLRDFAEAMVEAADEIMPAEDEPGDEDPAVRA